MSRVREVIFGYDWLQRMHEIIIARCVWRELIKRDIWAVMKPNLLAARLGSIRSLRKKIAANEILNSLPSKPAEP